MYTLKDKIFGALGILISHAVAGITVYYFMHGNKLGGWISAALLAFLIIITSLIEVGRLRLFNTMKEIQLTQQKIIEGFKRHYDIPS